MGYAFLLKKIAPVFIVLRALLWTVRSPQAPINDQPPVQGMVAILLCNDLQTEGAVAKAVLLKATERFEKPFASSLVAPPCQCLKHECAILRGLPGALNSDGLRLGR